MPLLPLLFFICAASESGSFPAAGLPWCVQPMPPPTTCIYPIQSPSSCQLACTCPIASSSPLPSCCQYVKHTNAASCPCLQIALSPSYIHSHPTSTKHGPTHELAILHSQSLTPRSCPTLPYPSPPIPTPAPVNCMSSSTLDSLHPAPPMHLLSRIRSPLPPPPPTHIKSVPVCLRLEAM
jgi:hypothetical protein